MGKASTPGELSRGERGLLVAYKAVKAAVLAAIYGAGGYVVARAIFSEKWTWVTAGTAMGTYLVVLLLHPLSALLGWLIVSPYAPFFGLDIHLGAGVPDLSLDRVAVGSLLAFLLAQAVLGRRTLARFTRTDALILTFCLGYGVSGIISDMGPTQAYQALFDAVYTPILVYFLAKNLVRSRRDLNLVVGALAVICTYLAILAIREQITGEVLFHPAGRSTYYTKHIRRIAGLLGNPVFIDVIIAMSMPLLLVQVLRSHSRWVKWGGLALTALSGVGVYMTFTRAGWGALALGLITLAVLWPGFRKPLVPLLVIGVVVAALNWSVITESYAFTERLTFTKSIESRMVGMELAWRVFLRYPLVGAGFANFGNIALREFGWSFAANVPPSPHNSYLYIAVSGGLLAVVPYFLMFLSMVWDGWRLYWRGGHDPRVDRPLVAAFLACLVGYLAPIATFEVEASKPTNMLFFLIVGTVLGAYLWLDKPGGIRRIREEVPL